MIKTLDFCVKYLQSFPSNLFSILLHLTLLPVMETCIATLGGPPAFWPMKNCRRWGRETRKRGQDLRSGLISLASSQKALHLSQYYSSSQVPFSSLLLPEVWSMDPCWWQEASENLYYREILGLLGSNFKW